MAAVGLEDEVVPLLRVEEDRCVVDENTLQWLSGRKDPFIVMACTGKFRTGKSFLLNRFTDCAPGKGFGVGGTVQACTRGLWICRRFISPADGSPGRDVLVVDTEGIDALDVSSSHDMRIFALAVLLSSVFCFNSMSHIDEAAIQTLSLMTRVAASMSSVSHNPHLYWVLRDFSLQMVDEAGAPITHGQYLESALATSAADASKCATRNAIKDIFKERHLVTLPRPHKSESARLERIDQLNGGGSVNAKFERFLNTFRQHVFSNGPVMSAGSISMSGQVYADYIRTVVSLVNETQSVPKLEDAWSMLTRVQHTDAKQQLYRALLDHACTHCPVSTKEGVGTWLEEAGKVICAEGVEFMAPAPDWKDVIPPIVEDVRSVMCSMNRVQSEEQCAQSRVDEVVEALRGNELPDTWDMIQLMEGEVGMDASAAACYTAKALGAVVRELWPIVRNRLQDLGDRLSRTEALKVAMEEDVTALRERETALKTELFALTHVRCEDASTLTDDDAAGGAVGGAVGGAAGGAAGGRESCDEEETEALLRKIQDGERRAEEAEARRVDAETKAARLKETCDALDEGMEGLREEALANVRQHKDKADMLRKETAHATAQRDALLVEVDKLQRLLRESQDKAVDIHHKTLEDMRRRDAETRSHNDEVRKTQSELYARSDVAEREVRTLKRRVDELLEADAEVKRLRTAQADKEIEATRRDVENTFLRRSLEALQTERDLLRDSNMEMGNRMAVMEATHKLESCRRSIRDA